MSANVMAKLCFNYDNLQKMNCFRLERYGSCISKSSYDRHGDTQLEVIFIQFVALMYSEFTIDCDLSCDLGIWNWL